MRLDDYEEAPIPPGTIGVPSSHECLVHGREVKLVRPDRGQWFNDRAAAVFFADIDDLRLTRLTNEEIGMGIVLATVWDARKGVHDHRDAYDTLYRLFPEVFEEIDDRALLVTLYALDTRMPFSFRSSSRMSSKVLREAYDDQGWSGEMAILNTSITRPAPGARLWFSDETTAVAARMLF